MNEGTGAIVFLSSFLFLPLTRFGLLRYIPLGGDLGGETHGTKPGGGKVGKRMGHLSFLALTLNVTVEQMILKSNDYTHLLARGESPPPESIVLFFHSNVITHHSRREIGKFGNTFTTDTTNPNLR